MLTHVSQNRSLLTIAMTLAGVLISIAAGFMAGVKTLYLGLLLAALVVLICFVVNVEYTVLGLLILRSGLDSFSAVQIPAAFAVGLDALTLLYVLVLLLSGKIVRVDRFWWFLAAWVALQGLWIGLLCLGGLGLDAEYLSVSIREWVRLFSWLMVYLLVMQLQDRLPPQKVISLLFLALVAPLVVASMQLVVPSLLPGPLAAGGGELGTLVSEGYRIRGTFGHPNTFATLLLLFIGLTWWKLGQSERIWRWIMLLGLLAFFLVSTKALFSLMLLTVFVLILVAPKLSPLKLLGGVLLLALAIGLFASTEFGQQRLGSIGNTPLLNPDIDISRAILLSQSDHNSFNWRLSQWYLLLNAWRHYPILGYGLGLSIQTAGNGLLPHNDYIRALIEGGLVGLCSFLAFLAAQVAWLLQLIRWSSCSAQRQLCSILLAVALVIPLGMLTENIWSHTTFFFYWWTVLAVAGWDWNRTTGSAVPPDSALTNSLRSESPFSSSA